MKKYLIITLKVLLWSLVALIALAIWAGVTAPTPEPSITPTVARSAEPSPTQKPIVTNESAAPTVLPGPVGPYYRDCDAAREAGVAPLRADHPGYRKALDRNGDGVACE